MRAGAAAAGVTFSVMVVVAMKVFPDLQNTVDKSNGNRPGISFSSAYDLYSGIGKSIDSSSADTSADEDINFLCGKESGKSSVTGISGRELFFRNYLVVFSFKDGKSGSMSEVLKDHTIFTGNCDFHIIPFFNYQALPRQRSGNYPAFFEKGTAYASKRCLLAM